MTKALLLEKFPVDPEVMPYNLLTIETSWNQMYPPAHMPIRITLTASSDAGVQLPEQGIKDIRHTLLSECNPSVLEAETPTTAKDPSPAFDPVGMNKPGAPALHPF